MSGTYAPGQVLAMTHLKRACGDYQACVRPLRKDRGQSRSHDFVLQMTASGHLLPEGTRPERTSGAARPNGSFRQLFTHWFAPKCLARLQLQASARLALCMRNPNDRIFSGLF